LVARVTNRGTDRAGGGSFERRFIWLSVFGADGALRRWEFFDADRDPEALARFEELAGGGSPPPRGTVDLLAGTSFETPPEEGGSSGRADNLRRFNTSTVRAEEAPSFQGPSRSPRSSLSAAPVGEGAEAIRRRLRPNAVTVTAARLEQAIAARDRDALADPWAEGFECADHTTGAVFGRKGITSTWRSLLTAQDPACRYEPLATLGDALALLRFSRSGREISFATFDVGAFDVTEIHLLEGDASGCLRRAEVFAADKLGDAVVRLYERYAERLPDGPDRARAAATARVVAALGRLEFHGTFYIPSDIQVVDHRRFGFEPMSGAEAIARGLRTLDENATDLTARIDDVLCLQSDALLIRFTNAGTVRAGGGAFERQLILLFVFGGDGLARRVDVFDADRDAEAFARFDELAHPSVSPLAKGRIEAGSRPGRRVRPNAASALLARFEAAFAPGDDVHAAIWSNDVLVLDHPTGSSYGYEAHVRSFRQLAQSSGPRLRLEPLATLGDSLVLCRSTLGARGRASGNFDVGQWERDEVVFFELGENARCRRVEIFAIERLTDAVARLRERYAEIQPEGPARTRAAAIARAGALWSGRIDPDRIAATLSPSFKCVDHRSLGTWSASGPEEWLMHWRLQLDLAPDFAPRGDDILALEPDAFLARQAYCGTDRAGGGAFENMVLALTVFGADGLVTRAEVFEPDRKAEALARFDELLGSEALHPAEVFANAATRLNERFTRAWAARDWDALWALYAPTCQFEDRRRLMRLTGGVELTMAQFRVYFEVPNSRWIMTPIATRGERLALTRMRFEGDVDAGGGGDLLIDYLVVDEVDGEGHSVAIVAFDPDDEDAAYAEVDARFEADPAAPQARPRVAWARAVAQRDWDAVVAMCNPAFTQHDHRRLALLGTTPGPEAWSGTSACSSTWRPTSCLASIT
jgi:hypothetical protein